MSYYCYILKLPSCLRHLQIPSHAFVWSCHYWGRATWRASLSKLKMMPFEIEFVAKFPSFCITPLFIWNRKFWSVEIEIWSVEFLYLSKSDWIIRSLLNGNRGNCVSEIASCICSRSWSFLSLLPFSTGTVFPKMIMRGFLERLSPAQKS